MSALIFSELSNFGSPHALAGRSVQCDSIWKHLKPRMTSKVAVEKKKISGDLTLLVDFLNLLPEFTLEITGSLSR